MSQNTRSPLVAVVIVHYGSRDYTISCVDSVLENDYADKYVVVVDNAMDDSLNLHFQSYRNTLYVRNSANTGYTGGNNLGIVLAKSVGCAYLLILNNDAVIASDFLSCAVAYMQSAPHISLISPKICYWDFPGIINSAGGRLDMSSGLVSVFGDGQPDAGKYNTIGNITFAIGCALFLRSEVFDTVGLFDTRFFCYGEDVDFSRRILAAGLRMIYYPRARAWHKHVTRIGNRTRTPTYDQIYYEVRNQLYNFQRVRSGGPSAAMVMCITISRAFVAFLIKYRKPHLCIAISHAVHDYFKGVMGMRDRLSRFASVASHKFIDT